MPQAQSLQDLMAIRRHNLPLLEKFNGENGTVLGFRYQGGQNTGEPAVIVFVDRKIHNDWLPPSKKIPKSLMEPGGLECPLDVVEIGFPEFQVDEPLNFDEISMMLRGFSDRIYIGSQLSVYRPDFRDPYVTASLYGTLAGFVKDSNNGDFGFLTNAHVALNNSDISFPEDDATYLGYPERTVMTLPIEDYFGPTFEEPNTYVKVDAGFVMLDNPAVTRQQMSTDILTQGAIGAVKEISLNDMSIIGTEVLRIGRTTGIRHGIVWGFGFETLDVENETEYTDLMIIGEKGRPFSAPGDSGSLIVTKNGLHPIGLMWGGHQFRGRKGRSYEDWSFGTGLSQALKALEVDFLTTL